MGIMDTMHLLKGGRFRNKGRDPGRDTGERCQQAGVALRMARVVVTGAGWINDNRAASPMRFLQLPTGLHDFGSAGLSILRTSCRRFLQPSGVGETGAGTFHSPLMDRHAQYRFIIIHETWSRQ